MVRPKFSETTTAIKSSMHPILALSQQQHAPVPNDVYLSRDTNFVIISGPNMSGKSIYLRQVALLQVMAQLGCYIPADFATFKVATQLFTRIGAEDSVETNSSTFAVECQELNYVLCSVKASSLVIIDELGRGTSAEEGIGLCYASCEHLQGTGAFTLFATHFLELCSLDMYPNVTNMHLEVVEEDVGPDQQKNLVYTHTLKPGVTTQQHYGLKIAERTRLPDGVKVHAWKLAQEMQDSLQVSSQITVANTWDKQTGCGSCACAQDAAHVDVARSTT
eukprot:m.282526 g.282526  ORF g.282526 m.282526 type:complete len:277 (+) comp15755_c0_seq44:2637-3467(+)